MFSTMMRDGADLLFRRSWVGWFAMTFFTTALVAAAACSAEAEPAPIACAAPEHDGLLCWTDAPGDIGRCTQGQCAALGCSLDADCGAAECRVNTCVIAPGAITGTCSSAPVPEGQGCVFAPGQPGFCDHGHCLPQP